MFKDFFIGLTVAQRRALAEKAGTTVGYIRTHLIAPPERRKTPNKALMYSLAEACREMGAPFGRSELIEYFYEKSTPTNTEAAA